MRPGRAGKDEATKSTTKSVAAARADAANKELGELLDEIECGRPLAEAVIDAARLKSSAMHAYFTWDDAKAGHLYRLKEAEKILNDEFGFY